MYSVPALFPPAFLLSQRVLLSPFLLSRRMPTPMVTSARRFHDINDLRHFVSQTLCDADHLEPDCFPMTERMLLRGDAPCGVLFSLYGPRSVVLSAIWETDRNTLLFYNSRGERFCKIQLAATPRLSPGEKQI